MMKKKTKDGIFLAYQILIAAIGLAVLVLRGNTVFIAPYLFCMCFIPFNYFAYTVRRWSNRWHGVWNEKNPSEGEPSAFSLVLFKISAWFFIILALVFALLRPLPV